jgi:hypothetical protein
MTCFKTLSLLDEYIDNELTPPDSELVQRHLEICPSCQAEHDRSIQLKGYLKNIPVPQPPKEYWDEVSAIIKAKTVDSIPIIRDENSFIEIEHKHRVVFVRSAIVFAASLALLVTSLLLSNHFIPRPMSARDSSPKNIVAGLGNKVDQDAQSIITRQEQIQIATGSVVVGAPSMVNRYSGLIGFWDGH